jgi:hypothetical protein
MFGRPKAATGLFLSQEVGSGLDIISRTVENQHPDATPADVQGVAVWVYSLLLHIILTLGRTDRDAVQNLSYSFGLMMSEAPPEGRWALDKLAEEIHECQKLLRTNVGSNNWPGFEEAARSFYHRRASNGEELKIPEVDFVRHCTAIAFAWVDRLRQSGHIKLR